MRRKTSATLAALALGVATVATAGSASATGTPEATGTSVPTVEHRTRTLNSDVLGDLRTESAVSPGGNLRVSGGDRYETAAAISQAAGWDGETTSVVYLASGTSLPDALAVGPSTGGLGPVLLTERDRLPAATRAELQRLRPCLLVVLGGTPSVSDGVFTDAERYVDTSGCAS